MPQQLHYGARGALSLDIPEERLVGQFPGEQPAPLDDPSAAVAAAATDPLNYPALFKATVPGDHIVLALDRGLPQAAASVAGVVQTLLEGHATAENITVLLPENGRCDPQRYLALLAPEVRRAVHVERHDPRDEEKLAYLAASKDGKPIYLNRAICEADLVVPLGVLRLENSLGYVGVHGGLFPTFADEETQRRFRAPSSSELAVHRRRRREEADEAAWLLGVQFTVQVAPGQDNQLLHVLAGESGSVAEQGRRLCRVAWDRTAPQRASLVIASIAGDADQQTWENFARALFAAEQVVEDGGMIVLCTDLASPPGPSLKRLAGVASDEAVLRQIRRDRDPDALTAALLVETRRRASVYLLSHLASDSVEEIGLGHVDRPEAINRLAQQHESCILIQGAQHAAPHVQGEAVA